MTMSNTLPPNVVAALELLTNATSISEIRAIASGLSASGNGGAGGIIYSGKIAEASSEYIATQIAKSEGLSIINLTERYLFLKQPDVAAKIERIFLQSGMALNRGKSGTVYRFPGSSRTANAE